MIRRVSPVSRGPVDHVAWTPLGIRTASSGWLAIYHQRSLPQRIHQPPTWGPSMFMLKMSNVFELSPFQEFL